MAYKSKIISKFIVVDGVGLAYRSSCRCPPNDGCDDNNICGSPSFWMYFNSLWYEIPEKSETKIQLSCSLILDTDCINDVFDFFDILKNKYE
jgi:hypothetical protein